MNERLKSTCMILLAFASIQMATAAQPEVPPHLPSSRSLIVSVARPAPDNPAAIPGPALLAQLNNGLSIELRRILGRPAQWRPLFSGLNGLDRSRFAKDSAIHDMDRFIYLEYESASEARTARFALQRDQRFGFVELNSLPHPAAVPTDFYYPFPPNAPDLPAVTAYQWHLHSGFLAMPGAWNKTKGSGRIGILDTSVDVNHPDLVDRFNYFGSWNFRDGQRTIPQFMFPGVNYAVHGTHVASLASAKTELTGQGSGGAGVCWNCSTLFGAWFDDVSLVKAGEWLSNWGAQSINLSGSFGDFDAPYPPQSLPPRTPCATFEQTKGGAHPFCSVLRLMAEREISFVSASGPPCQATCRVFPNRRGRQAGE